MKMSVSHFARSVALGSLFLLLGAAPALAGVFNIPHFVAPGEFAIGVEPEVILSNGAGVGVNAKFVQGLGDWSNLTAILGSGSGPRKFRVGASGTFDFFPDITGQPGIGLAVQALYVRLKDYGQLETTLIPYVHKTFATGQEGNDEVEPYVAIPIGMAFSEGSYRAISSVAVGSYFKNTANFRYVMEIGIAVNRTDSYVSGGVIYYH